MMPDSTPLPEAIIKPAISLICAYCQKSHKVSSDIKATIIECIQCKKKLKVPENLTEVSKRINDLSLFDQIQAENQSLKELVSQQEAEIKELKGNKSYSGLLPANAKMVNEIIGKLQDQLNDTIDEFNTMFEPDNEDEDQSQSSSQLS